MISKGMFTRSKVTLVHVSDPPKKPTIRDKTKPLSFQKVGLKSKQHGVIRIKHLVVLSPFPFFFSRFKLVFYTPFSTFLRIYILGIRKPYNWVLGEH
jgi:hypothetical protein